MITRNLTRFQEIQLDIINGLYSNFPLCCIDWFIWVRYLSGTTEPVGTYTWNRYGAYKTADWAEYWNDGWPTGPVAYVQCPNCIKNRVHRMPHEIRDGIFVYWDHQITFFHIEQVNALMETGQWN